MASDTQETLFENFQAVSGQQDSSAATIFDSEYSVATTLDQVMGEISQQAASGSQSGSAGTSGTSGGQAASTGEPQVVNVSSEVGDRAYTTPTTVNVAQNASSGSGGGSSALSLATSVFGSGLGIVPLVTGLLGLFGGSSEPPSLEKYIKPDQLDFTGTDTASGIENADYDQFGMPRLFGDTATASTTQSGSLNAAPASTAPASAAGSPINVTIQALDSQSFLDRSSDIAQAVRQAMLNSSSINDVVNDL